MGESGTLNTNPPLHLASEKLSVGIIGIIGSWLRQVRSPLVSLLVIEAKYLRKQLKEIKMYFTYDF